MENRVGLGNTCQQMAEKDQTCQSWPAKILGETEVFFTMHPAYRKALLILLKFPLNPHNVHNQFGIFSKVLKTSWRPKFSH